MTEKKEEKNRETIFPFGMETKKIKKAGRRLAQKRGAKQFGQKLDFGPFVVRVPIGTLSRLLTFARHHQSQIRSGLKRVRVGGVTS